MSLAILAMSSAFPQEFRLMRDIISGQYLFLQENEEEMLMDVFHNNEEGVETSKSRHRKLEDFAKLNLISKQWFKVREK